MDQYFGNRYVCITVELEKLKTTKQKIYLYNSGARKIKNNKTKDIYTIFTIDLILKKTEKFINIQSWKLS